MSYGPLDLTPVYKIDQPIVHVCVPPGFNFVTLTVLEKSYPYSS